jgi:hypothetical protein
MSDYHEDQAEKLAAARRAVPRHNSLENHAERLRQEENAKWMQARQEIRPDPVNHPSHYTSGGIETIDFIEAKELNYNLGNAVKYITRAGKKFPEELVNLNIKNLNAILIQDLEKAVWYLQREIKTLREK